MRKFPYQFADFDALPRAKDGLSIILVQQNSRVALEFSPRAVVIDKGRVVFDGEWAALRADPERLSQLIGCLGRELGRLFPDPQRAVAGNVLEVIVACEHRQVMTDTKLG